MKNILSLCLCTSLLLGGEVHFSFYEETSQKIEIPYDATFRLYSAPIDLIDTRQTPLLKLIFNGCASRVFHIDNIRFPSNAYIDFEDGLPDLTHSVGISQISLIQHPSDSGYVMQVQFDPDHFGRDTLRIQRPDSWYPAVPDRVGLEFQADVSVQLFKYYKPMDLARYEVSVDDWSFSTMVEKVNEVLFSDSMIIDVKRLIFPNGEEREVSLESQIYEYSSYNSNLLSLNGMLFNFEAGLYEYVMTDSVWGSWLVDEYYAEIFNRLVFVKKITRGGPIGNALYFGYGMGFMREDFPGTSVHVDLVGFQDQGVVTGDLNLPVSVYLGVGYESQGITMFPPDTNWYHYTIPLSMFHVGDPQQTFTDSLMLVLSPTILANNHDSGSLLFNRLTLWDAQSLVFDYGTRNHNEWEVMIATNGSDMNWQYSQEMPPGGLVLSSQLNFSNSWQGGDQFMGWVEYHNYFSTSLPLEDAHYKFWLKQPHVMTGIDEFEIMLPEEFGISKAYPNPFNGTVRLSVSWPVHAISVSVVIYDLKSRQLWSQEIENTDKHVSHVTWNGKNLSGQKLGSGLYIATLQVEGQVADQIQKIILLK